MFLLNLFKQDIFSSKDSFFAFHETKKNHNTFLPVGIKHSAFACKAIRPYFFNNQLQEEIPHAPFEKCSAEKDMFKSDLLLNGSYPLSALFTTEAKQYPHLIIALPAAHAAEILTPPPNFS